MRRDEGKYQLRALLIVAGCFALLLIVPMALIRWQMYVAKRTAADAVANFSNLKQPEVKKNHELKAVDVAQKINVKKIKDAIKFVPEISPDEKVEAQLILGANEIGTVDGGQTIVSVPDSTLLTDSPTDSPTSLENIPHPWKLWSRCLSFPAVSKLLCNGSRFMWFIRRFVCATTFRAGWKSRFSLTGTVTSKTRR